MALAVAGAVTLLKLLLGERLGSEAPFAFFGIALTLAGWTGGARSAYVLTSTLTLVWWYFFLEPHNAFAVDSAGTLAQLAALLAEGVAVSAVLARMESARRSMHDAVSDSNRLQELAVALAAARTPEDVARIIVEQGVAALGATSGSVVQPRGKKELELIAQRGLPEEVARTFKSFPISTELPASVAYLSGKPEWIEDRRSYSKRYPAMRPEMLQLTGAAAALPLVTSDGRVLAVAGFRFSEERSFAAGERALMTAIIAQCAQAFERAELYADEVAARRKLAELDALTSALSTALTRDEVARVVVESGMQAATADVCTLYVTDEGQQSLELIADRGVSPDVLEKIRHLDAGSNNPAFDTLSSGEAHWAETPEDYQEFAPELANLEARGPRARAFWSVPLITEGKPAGLLGMGFFAPRRFPPEERMFVETFARHCAEALRRAQRLDAERTARALAERLQSSLATTLRSIGDAVISTDARGDVTFMNPVAEALTGWSVAEAQGRKLAEVFRIESEHTRQTVENPVERVLREGVVVGLANHTVLVSRDGTQVTPIDDSGAPIRNERGGIEGVVLVFRDVSHKKQEEARLTLLTEAARALSESLDPVTILSRVARLAVPQIADWVGVDVLNEDGKPHQVAVAHVDPEKVELARRLNARYPAHEDAASGVPAVLRSGRSEYHPLITDDMLQAGAHDAEHLRISRELMLRSAMIVPLTARGRTLGAMTFVAAESGRSFTLDDLRFAEDLAGRCALGIDNARLFTAEQRARHSADLANRAKDEFLATVSHELRTPLNAIMGWSKLLSSAALTPEKRERGVETIERNAVAMAQLIEDLLDVSRIISGKMRLELSAMNLPQVLQAAIESVRPAAEAKGVVLKVALDELKPPVLGDSTRIQQVLWNLLSNAVKFTPPAGSVSVMLRSLVDSQVEIEVVDTGKGIDGAFLPHVFEAFRQEETRSRTQQERARPGLGHRQAAG